MCKVNIEDQLLSRYSAFIEHEKKNGNRMRQYIICRLKESM